MKTSFLFILCICFANYMQAQSSVDDKSTQPTTTKTPTKSVVLNNTQNTGSSVPQMGEEISTIKTNEPIEEVGSSVYDTPILLKNKRKEEPVVSKQKK